MEKLVEERFTISRSKFIICGYKVKREEEFKNELKLVKNSYLPNADHYLYTYRILDNGVIKEGFSENGEPISSSKKFLFVLKSKDIKNVAIIITRYFGGKKLGASNLDKLISNAYNSTLEKMNDSLKKE